MLEEDKKVFEFDDFLEGISKYGKSKISIQDKKALPFVKWVGGKRSILEEVKKYLPCEFKEYYEPFIGGGAMFFNLGNSKSYISDINLELITAYLIIKKDVKKLIDRLKEHKTFHCEDYFYKTRLNQFPNDPVEVASRFIYINKTCYNGLYRVNKKGEFNSPFGKYTNPKILDEENLLLCSKYLKNTIIRYGNFQDINPKKNDLVYFDPPYHQTYSGYSANIFDEAKQIELRIFCDQLTKQGVFFMLSNSDTSFIREQYSKYNINSIVAPRFINCKSNGRKGGQEVLITNYDTKRSNSK